MRSTAEHTSSASTSSVTRIMLPGTVQTANISGVATTKYMAVIGVTSG